MNSENKNGQQETCPIRMSGCFKARNEAEEAVPEEVVQGINV